MTQPPTTAVILAAGRGTRLARVAGDLPKCLVPIGGRTLLDRQVASLAACGVGDVTVVAGYQAERVAAACRSTARTIVNADYAATNSLYSLWLARDLLSDGFVVLNADVLFHPRLLVSLLTSPFEDALLAESRDGRAAPFGDEEMKVSVRAGCVADIDKTMPAEEADAENLGIARFGTDGARLLVRQLDSIVAGGRLREWVPRAFQGFARIRPLHVVEARGFPWIEIDFPEDYSKAVREVLPLIEATGVAAGPGTEAHEADWRPQAGHV